jgi:hypothetical protein
MDTHVTFGFQLAKAEEERTCLTWGRSANGSSHRHLKHAITPRPLDIHHVNDKNTPIYYRDINIGI